MINTFKYIFLSIILSSLFINSFGQTVNLQDWEHERIIVIDNKTNSDSIINHPFLINLDSTYIDFSKTKPNGDDLLFVDSDSLTLLSFWIESWTDSLAKVWVKIPLILANNEKKISLFYGNPAANSASNGKTTFKLFDSFETFNEPMKNALNPQITPTYEGSGKAVHPDIVYIPDGWNGYKYWMAMTPFPVGQQQYENPSILVSDDGTSWIVPPGLTNPLVPEPSSGWNNDTDMLLVDGVMILYFNETSGDGNTYMKRMTSTDGINWSSPLTVITVPSHLMSPTIIYENGNYFMWYARSPGGCFSNYQNITLRTSSDGITWASEVPVNIPHTGRAVWHLDVVKTDSNYVMLFPSYSKNSNCDDETSLYYAVSTDKINWEVNENPILVSPNSSSAWDGRQIYRTTFLVQNDSLRIWYSAYKLYGNWRIGYTEGKITDFVDKIFWSERQGGLIATTDYSHSGDLGLKQYYSDSKVPKVFRSVSDSGSFNVWLYDEMNTSVNDTSMFRLTDVSKNIPNNIWNSIGVGINKVVSQTEYVYDTNESNFLSTNISRTVGWHKFTMLVRKDSVQLYIDDNYVMSFDDLNQYSTTRLSLEGGTQGNSWFDDIYWIENLSFNPPISPIPDIFLPNVKIFLEGAYEGTELDDSINSFIPKYQPYNVIPWQYLGSEDASTIPVDAVDWILVELRNGLTSDSVVTRRAAFLNKNGFIVDIDGINNVKFLNTLADDYYLVIYHRNHLPVMSSSKIRVE